MVIKIEVSDLVKQAKGRGTVKFIVGDDFNICSKVHPLESYFMKAGIPYEFGRTGNGKFYEIDLTMIEVVY